MLPNKSLVVSYPKSSSNHNYDVDDTLVLSLYLILNHHQTTTKMPWLKNPQTLYLILNHHQTTTLWR